MNGFIKAVLAASFCCGIASAASAGIGAEGLGARADGHWGGEIGAGYSWGIAGFSITPGAGVLASDDRTRLYGRVEAAYKIPLFAKVGAGVRFSGDHTRPYGTVALPILPKLDIKGNAGPKYYALGLTLGY
ncbi:hypothetical protein HZF05_12170 [Sphingomonas sp. CGMCC 1.13654]|uniref:Uncharacterized protein n=1 Tax=Sphingomonas chungangi TaxID=2683589 RepID=A0A838L6S1_9SPHN|nr:hypothetical protein [Sphingomonas chungangi]MBA2934854.1 hypothetical protein [Sphingomonas chungangi]MVW58165.1 hypothetical protein [Sphingomonas chungangi]